MTSLGNILQDSGVSVPADIQADLRFRLLPEGSTDVDYLWINATSGDMKTASRIDREVLCRRQSLCELNVQAVVQAHSGSFFTVITVKVIVTDINDNTPAFDPQTVTLRVSEDQSVGSTFRLPTAVDLDGGDGHSVRTYNQGASTPRNAPFSVIVSGGVSPEQFGAELRLDSSLDREATPTYTILVHAVDGGTPEARTGTSTVLIEVEDVNDHAQAFDRSFYSVNISEIARVGDVVLTVSATDRDAGQNGVVTYSAPAASQDNDVALSLFSLNASTGQIETLTPLDTYAGQTYRLTVEARDGGVNPQMDTAEVVISVVDTHNSHPEIVLNFPGEQFGEDVVVRVSELAELDYVVAVFDVSDPDSASSPNGQVTCSLHSGHFELQPMDINAYKIKLTRALNREAAPYDTVTVTCADAGDSESQRQRPFCRGGGR